MTSVHATGSPRVAFVQSNWHADIVEQARQGFHEVATSDLVSVEYFAVPGAFELPLYARLLAETGRFDAIVAAGLVVDGGIYRHEFVANAVISGLMRVQLDLGIPLLSCVLTPQQFPDDAIQRRFYAEHMSHKGREVAHACLATLAAHSVLTTAS